MSFITYLRHLLNVPFIIGSIAGALCFGAMFTFISASSAMIIAYFKLGYIMYCIIFAANVLGIMFASFIVKNKSTSSNQNKFMIYGYVIAFIMVILNILLSYIFNNIYLFTCLKRLLI